MKYLSGLLLAASLALSACGATRAVYKGDPLPQDQEVQLLGEDTDAGTIYIASVDGEPTQRLVRPGIYVARLKPGRRSVTLAVVFRTNYGRRAEGTTNLWFEGVPGRTYQARARNAGGVPRVWIEDTSTGAVVGGVDDNPPAFHSNHIKN